MQNCADVGRTLAIRTIGMREKRTSLPHGGYERLVANSIVRFKAVESMKAIVTDASFPRQEVDSRPA
jgi:hypothetical protein